MRFLGVGETCDLGALYLSLQAEGHDVRVCVSDPMAGGTLAGMVRFAPDWRAELDWVGEGGVILFESVSEGYGALQDQLRREGFKVIGGSAYGDRLENDRAYAQQVLAELGFSAPGVWPFSSAAEGADFIARRPARYVLKYSGADHAAADTYVGILPDGRDVAALLAGKIAAGEGEGRDYILMAFIEGVEVGVGAYFDGERFLRPACLDWEHKRFFAGDLGELTGEMGTVATFQDTEAFFERTLARLEGHLRQNGHVGYVNLNTMVNEGGVWPLEFTCRFGYPGFAILAPLQTTPWGELFQTMIARSSATFETREGFSVGVVLTTPPFPYSRKQVAEPVGLPVLFDKGVDLGHCHYGEVGLDAGGNMVTSGLYGWTMVVTGVGETIALARTAAYANVARVFVPNLRYRLDIGERLIARDHARFLQLTA